MTEQRRFSGGEHVALYLAADGRCSGCGTELEPGWHADHVQPWSRGGQTDVINGQAFCPTCNLKKGSKVSQLRVWQEEALTRFLRNSNDFLVVATPGAGKTRLALAAVKQAIERDEIRQVIVVVPTAHLRGQWAAAAAAEGIQLDHRFVNGSAVIASDFDGAVITYATVAASPDLWRKITSMKPTLVIPDEIHHCGDDDKGTWGPALKRAFEPAVRRLLLSGTPFRSDGAPIPFVRYDEDRRCIPDYDYDYGKALADGGVVRPVEFPALDGDMTWRTAGQVVRSSLSQVDDNSVHQAMSAAYSYEGSWIPSVLRQADQELSRHRETAPDAGGLVIAPDQERAYKYREILEKITGQKPALAVTDESDASDQIRRFADSCDRWIVAVQMISEGVDIPRLEVGVYTSRVRTELFFRQVVGRFVRMRGLEDEACATLFIPSVKTWLEYAAKIELTVDRVLREVRDELKDLEREPQDTLVNLVEPMDSSDASLFATVHGGESFPDAELRRADDLIRIGGLPSATTAAQLARVLRLAGTGRVIGTATIQAPERPLADKKHTMRRLISTKVGRLAYQTNEPHKNIHAELNQLCGDRVATATMQTLDQRLTILDDWLEKS